MLGIEHAQDTATSSAVADGATSPFPLDSPVTTSRLRRSLIRRAFAIGAVVLAASVALVPEAASAGTLGIASAGVAAPSAAPAAVVAPLVRATQTSRQAAIDRDLLAYVNKARAAYKRAPLVEVKELVGLAHTWSTHLAQGPTVATFVHNPNLSSMVVSRMPVVHSYGENIAAFSTGSYSAYALLKSYLASPSHRANILSPYFRYVGIVTHSGPNGLSYNTMDFAG